MFFLCFVVGGARNSRVLPRLPRLAGRNSRRAETPEFCPVHHGFRAETPEFCPVHRGCRAETPDCQP